MMGSTEKITFKMRTPLPARIGVAVLFAFPFVHASIVIAIEMSAGVLPVPLVYVAGVLLVLIFATLDSGAYASVTSAGLRVGFFPVWVTRIPHDQIRSVDIVSVDAYRDYNGWGIKGSAKSTKGRLYSAGGSAAVRIHTAEKGTFLVAFPGNSPALRDLQAAIEHNAGSPTAR